MSHQLAESLVKLKPISVMSYLMQIDTQQLVKTLRHQGAHLPEQGRSECDGGHC